MNVKIAFLVLLIATPFTSRGQDAAIPNDSASLIDKLEGFVAKEREAFDQKRREKTDAVVKILQQHLARETRASNLDAAIALRGKIASLSVVADEEAEEAEKDLLQWLNGKLLLGTWSYGVLKIEFRDDIAVVDSKEFSIEQTRNRKILLTPPDASSSKIELEISSNRSTVTSPSRPELKGAFYVQVKS